MRAPPERHARHHTGQPVETIAQDTDRDNFMWGGGRPRPTAVRTR